jgi:serine/threonine protein kinase
LEKGIAFSDLKPENIVIVRYTDIKESEITVINPCYKIKLIDIASLTYLKDIDDLKIS